MTGPLECDTTYLVNITAWNSEGESPASSSLFSTVCPAQASSEARAPLVFFSLGSGLYTKDITLEKNIWRKQTKVAQLKSGMFFLNPHCLNLSSNFQNNGRRAQDVEKRTVFRYKKS